MLKGILIKTTGDMEVVEYENELKTLQEYVDGYIDYVNIFDNVDMIINDEGKIKGLEPNYIATQLFRYDIIVGDVLVVGIGDEGENISLTDAQIYKILKGVR